MMAVLKTCSVVCCISGLLALIAVIVGFCLLPVIIRQQVIKNVIIQNGTPTYQQFIEPTIPIYMQIYIFDLVNEAEVLKGAKPFVVERGPYTYRETRVKWNLSWHDDSGHVTYMQNRTFFFDRNMSVGEDTDIFTAPNIPLLTLLNRLKNNSAAINSFLSLALRLFPKETLFFKTSVRNVTWGYTDPLLAWGHRFLPKLVPTDFIGVLTGTNATYDGVYKVVTGVKDPVHLGQILTFNHSKTVPFWSTREARLVNGSDGTLCPPFLNKSAVLPLFVSDICRSVYGVYRDTRTTAQGIPMYRFSAPPREMANATINPDNRGFCVPTCLPSGLIDLTSCKVIDGLHVPIVASYPHFLDGAPELVQAIGGLHPDPEWHRTYTNMEPTSGIVVEAFKRLQINLKMETVPGFERLGRIQSMFYPVLWLNESAVLNEAVADQIKEKLLQPMEIAYDAIYALLGLAIALATIGAAIWLFLFSRTSPSTVQIQVDPREDQEALRCEDSEERHCDDPEGPHSDEQPIIESS